jgi:oligopeptide transport system substrate-binding protein
MLRLPLILSASLLFVSCQKESQVDKATREGILLLGNSADPKSLDLQVVSGVIESNIMRALFEGMVQLHPTEDLGAPPGAALSVTPDETNTVWTVRLRPEAKWSDGTPVTAEDFRFSYERLLTPSFGAKYAEMLYFMEGAEAFNKGETKDFSTVGIKVTDPHGFVLTLRGPTPYFREVIKHYTWYPVPKHKVLEFGKIDMVGNPWSRAENLVGNGPFRIKSYRRNDHIEVERNPHYWDAGNFALNGIRFLPVGNLFTEARMFRDGQLHVTNTAPAEVVDLMKKVDPGSLRQEPYLGTILYRYNVNVKPLDDVRVRRALSLAIDRKAICESVFRGFEPAYGMTPPMGDYKPPQGVAFDPDSAKKLLAEAGFPGGKGFPRLKILIADKGTNSALATAIQAMWREHLGVEVEIQSKEWTAYMVAMQEEDYEIMGGGWIGDYIDPLTFLEMWTAGNGNNRTGWESEPFGAKLKESFKVTDPAIRNRLLREAEEELLAWTHPDNYVVPYMPGGSKFMRNPPPPLRAVFPQGVPPEYNIAPKDINGIQVPMSATPEGMTKVLVNFMTKSASPTA